MSSDNLPPLSDELQFRLIPSRSFLSHYPNTLMPESLLRALANQYLAPLFSGSIIEEAPENLKRGPKVEVIDPRVIAFRVHPGDNYRLLIRRAQPFEERSGPGRERRVIEAFVEILAAMGWAVQSEIRNDLLATFQRRVVARSIAEPSMERQLLSVLDQMAGWASRLYEGAPISSAIGIDPAAMTARGPSLSDIASEDFGAVLSNGYDTMLVFGPELEFAAHERLISHATESVYPSRHAAVARWTAIVEGRVAVALNRLGEILVFREGQLLFARRGGHWHFLTHEPVINQMGVPKDRSIREAIYETVLDASFSRTGACLGVVASNTILKWEDAVAESDRLGVSQHTKARTMAAAIDGRRFHELPRTLRQELVAIDGATVINHKGDILSVGAILTIAGGSTGGGRTAAAKTLARFGLGIKVSQDGGITGYRPPDQAGQPPAEAFKVM